jgi:PAS domain S-box-containing protein
MDNREGIDELIAAHERFFDLSIDMLCHLGFDGHFKRLNPAWERTLGFTRAELMSRPFIEFVHPDDRARTLEQNARVRGGGQALAFENRYLASDGSYRWFRWNAAPDSGERLIYSVARDVTDAKEAEAERERLMQELQTAMAEWSRSSARCRASSCPRTTRRSTPPAASAGPAAWSLRLTS